MKTVKVIKVLNHNVVQALNTHNEEVIVFGKGIGFGVKADDLIDSTKIEKEYQFNNRKNKDLYTNLVGICDENLVTLVEQTMTNIEQVFNQKPNENLRVALLDHLNFSIYRFNHGLNITNLFNDELEAMYEKEFNYSRSLLKEINQIMNVNLPDAEIGFITQHIHSALNNDESRSNLFMQIIMNSLEYLEDQHGLKYPKNSLEKIRLITHLKFALKRASEKTTLKNEFSPKIIENYPEAYTIAKDLSEYILENFNIKFQDAEIGYLTLHIQLIQSK